MIIDSDFEKLLNIFPDYLKEGLQNHPSKTKLLEIIMDVGRRPEGRFFSGSELLAEKIVSWSDLDGSLKSLGRFSANNRAGLEQSLHRISCIRNKEGIIIGITCRVGRCLIGSINVIRDLLFTNQSLLILGKPGTGKTTLIREISRVLADEAKKRVVVIDTSNEIGGESIVPHKGIGRARRMFVSGLKDQHSVMIEAVENHMPEVIIVDEIGSELESFAARSIAERGVQLIGTAHGQCLASLLKNPILVDLVGGIQSVTLSDDEAKRRKSQKTILERKAFPAFEMAIELNTRRSWTIHQNVLASVDSLLQGQEPKIQLRSLQKNGILKIQACTSKIKTKNPTSAEKEKLQKPLLQKKPFLLTKEKNNLRWLQPSSQKEEKFFASYENENENQKPKDEKKTSKKERSFLIYSLSLSPAKISKACQSLGLKALFTKSLEKADFVLVSRLSKGKNKGLEKQAKERKIPIYFLKNDSISQITNRLQILLKQDLL